MPSDMAEETNPQEKKQSSYTFEDAMNIADDIFKLQKEKDKEITTATNDDLSACAPEPFVPEFHD